MNNRTLFFGLEQFHIELEKDSYWYKRILEDQKDEAIDRIRKSLRLNYGTYLFLETDIVEYNKTIKTIDNKIDNLEKNKKIPNDKGTFTYPKYIIEKLNILKRSKEKYKIITKDKDKFLHLLGKKYYDEEDKRPDKKSKHTLHIEWVDNIEMHFKSNEFKDFKKDYKTIKYFYDNYINHENNKHKIIYHHLHLPLTDEEKALKQKEHIKKWRENNKEQYKKKQMEWREDNQDKMLKYKRDYLYYKKLLPLTKEQVREIEKEIKNIAINIVRKQQVHKFCDMIIADKKNHIIIKKMMKELDQKTMMKSVSLRLAYLKKTQSSVVADKT